MFFKIFYRQKNSDVMTGKQHSHNNSIEVIQIISGDGSIIIGDNQYFFSSGDVFCFDGLIPHYITPKDPKSYERNKLILDKSVVTALADERVCEFSYCRLQGREPLSLDNIFKKIYNSNKGNVFSALSEIFGILDLCHGQGSPHIPKSGSKVQTIISYINGNLQNELSIDEIADACYMSKYHMCRKFKEETGTTVGSYIKLQRIYLAKRLLQSSDCRISDVALETGFADTSHFTKVFSAEVGLTPSQYKKISARKD